MGKLNSFKDLLVWQKATELSVITYNLTKKFPKSEIYGLSNQMRRAAISINSNIAEGFKRIHQKKFSFTMLLTGQQRNLRAKSKPLTYLASLKKKSAKKS